MTVKKRLFISNILMILIPVFLSIVIGCVMMFTLRSFFDLDKGERMGKDVRFYYAVNYVRSFIAEDPDATLDELIVKLEAMQAKNTVKTLSYVIYKGEIPVYQNGAEPDREALGIAMERDGEHSYVYDETTLYTLDFKDFKIIMYNTDHAGFDLSAYESFRHTVIKRVLVMFTMVIIIVLCTNRLLTRIVIDSIATPLDKLIFGVRQIRDGNLEYRIGYHGNDEFRQVCEDFNEMAVYLQQSVNQQQQDYHSRKELLAGISHDLRTPLTSIKGYIIGLEQGIDTSPQIRTRYLQVLKKKTEELEFLINQLFLFSKIDIGEYPMKIEQIMLDRALEEIVADIGIEYELRGLKIHFRNFDVPVNVAADLGQLRTVLINICENAMKYVDRNEKKLSVDCGVIGRRAYITMTDNGDGVPAESLSRLFDVFYRTDRSRKDTGGGSGLGLAISRKVIERMGGTIAAENKKTGGLIIRITLPLTEGECSDEADTGDRG